MIVTDTNLRCVDSLTEDFLKIYFLQKCITPRHSNLHFLNYSLCLSVSVCLPACLSVCLSVSLSLSLSLSLFTLCLSVCLCPFTACPSVCLSFAPEFSENAANSLTTLSSLRDRSSPLLPSLRLLQLF